MRLYGHYNRWYDLNPEFVEKTLQARAAADEEPPPPYPWTDTREALAYCETTTCSRCPYASVCGSIMPEIREAKRQADSPARPR